VAQITNAPPVSTSKWKTPRYKLCLRAVSFIPEPSTGYDE